MLHMYITVYDVIKIYFYLNFQDKQFNKKYCSVKILYIIMNVKNKLCKLYNLK